MQTFEAHFGRALALRGAGRLADAVAAYDAALALRPASPHAHFNRGNALQALGRHDEATAAYDRLLALDPGDVQALNNRGVSLAALGRHAEALASYDAAIALQAGYAEALNNRSGALLALDRIVEALASVDLALARQPASATFLFARGRVLERAGRPAEALASYEAALRLRPGDPQGLCDRANALRALERDEEVLASYDAALAAAPDSVEALTNRGNVLQALGRHAEALASLERAAALSPDDPEVRWNEGLTRLALGDYARGWPLYESRWQVPALRLAPRVCEQPRWRGDEDVAGRTVLLHAEQGFGDAIQFVRYARELAGRGARVVVACAPALRRLFARADGVAAVVVPGREPLPAFDLHAPLMSLPLAFGTTLPTIPPAPYLAAEPARVQAWRERLGEGGFRVGLVWSGNPEFPGARRKACPPALLARLAATPGCRFASLQLGAAAAELQAIGGGVLDAGPDLHDFDDTAAAVAALDLVITIDTAVAHLAGALGRPVWILLPFAADWRWLVGRSDSPWYPSARLHRQPAPGDWAAVVERVATDLLAGSTHGPR